MRIVVKIKLNILPRYKRKSGGRPNILPINIPIPWGIYGIIYQYDHVFILCLGLSLMRVRLSKLIF
jgi:hypothetical protein